MKNVLEFVFVVCLALLVLGVVKLLHKGQQSVVGRRINLRRTDSAQRIESPSSNPDKRFRSGTETTRRMALDSDRHVRGRRRPDLAPQSAAMMPFELERSRWSSSIIGTCFGACYIPA